MDPYLLSIIEAADNGTETPGVHLVTTGGDLIRGRPCASSQFREITWPHYVRAVDEALKKRPRHERKENPVHATDVAGAVFGQLVEKQGGHVEPVLTLAEAVLSFGGGNDGMKLPVVRVPIKAVSSWWVAGAGDYIAADSGGGIFGGVVFPIGN